MVYAITETKKILLIVLSLLESIKDMATFQSFGDNQTVIHVSNDYV